MQKPMHKINEKTNSLPQELIARILVISGADKGKCFEITKSVMRIGRVSKDIPIHDAKVSTSHASVEYVDGNFFIFDQESTNGTFVDGKKITESVLKNGSEIRVGLSTLKFIYSLKKKEKNLLKKPKIIEDEQETRIKKPSRVERDSSYRAQTNTEKYPTMGKEKGLTGKSVHIYFVVIEGNDKNKRFALDKGTIIIGRIGADINLKDTDVSRKHLMIEAFGENHIFARDLASTNGTMVNGKKIANCKLSNGDEITVGKTVLKFFVE